MYPVRKLTQLPVDESYIRHETDVLAYWKKIKAYEMVRSVESISDDKFNFMDGPPFVTGELHTGHMLIGDLKDTTLRFQRMHGKDCSNKLGYDTHGLPIEALAMKELGLNTSADIETYGSFEFSEYCKKRILDFSGSWKPIYDSIGRWANFDNVYKTMDTKFMETVWWIFSQMNQKGLVYKGYKVVPYSYKCESPLSNFEAGLAYQDICTETAYVAFKLTPESSAKMRHFADSDDISIVAWTTTIWTLPSNVALCVSPELNYVMCQDGLGHNYIVSEESVKNVGLYGATIVPIGLGTELKGLEYIPLYDYMEFKYHKVLVDDYVKNSEAIGTGIVHISPSFGEDDCRVCLENGVLESKDLASTCLVNKQGQFDSRVVPYAGKLVFECDKHIIKELRDRNLVVRKQSYTHKYPFCYRTHTPLIYMAVSSFFVAVTKIKDRMIELNEKINWTKKEIGSKKFRNWLDNVRDWSISRNRYFGTPIPVWKSEDESEMVVIGSIAELVEMAKLDYIPTDLHLESVKHIKITSETTGNVLSLSGDLFDCWFESGSVPYGQIHYPFENSHYFDDKEFLCDFVAEGLDQTRGWFYTLLVIATIISDKPPFKNVVCTGLILDEDGKKISKSLGNFVDSNVLLNQYGADAIRVYLLRSPLVNAEPLLFKTKIEKSEDESERDKSDIKKVIQQLIPYVNGVKFFLEHYINSQTKDDPIEIEYICDNDDVLRIISKSNFTLMDFWILEMISNLRIEVEDLMSKYKIDIAVKKILEFIEDLTNWYIKNNRDRMKGLQGKTEWQTSLSVLFTVIYDFVIIHAPFMPFLSEHLYQHLSIIIGSERLPTVHLEGYPSCERPYGMIMSFASLYKISKLCRHVRCTTPTHASIKIPIKKCFIHHEDESFLKDVKKLIGLIPDDINCLEFEYIVTEKSDDALEFEIKLNSKAIGTKYIKNSGIVRSSLLGLSQETLKDLYNGTISQVSVVGGDGVELHVDSSNFEIISRTKAKELGPNMKLFKQDELMIIVDLTYDEDVHNKSQVSKFISFIQNFRKINGMRPWNKINIMYNGESIYPDKLFSDYSSQIEHRLSTVPVKYSDMHSEFSNKYSFVSYDKTDHEITLFIRCELD